MPHLPLSIRSALLPTLAVSAMFGLGMVSQAHAIEPLTSLPEVTTGTSESGYPFNSYYHDSRYQGLYLASELSSAGMNAGDVVDEISLKPSASPGQTLENVRIAYAWTSSTQFSNSWESTTVVWGPSDITMVQVVGGLWFPFDVSDLPPWNGSDSLIIEWSNDGTSYTTGGGAYVRETGDMTRAQNFFNDSDCGNYPFLGCAPSATENVASVLLTVTGGGPIDNDGDGYTSDVDCDDSDPFVNPGVSEVPCDGVDNDCDGWTVDDEDRDGDGWSLCADDCDDLDPLANPGLTESFAYGNCSDGADNDCDGATDASDSGCEELGDDDDAAGDDDDAAGDDDDAAGDDDDAAGDDDDAAGDDDDAAGDDDDDDRSDSGRRSRGGCSLGVQPMLYSPTAPSMLLLLAPLWMLLRRERRA